MTPRQVNTAMAQIDGFVTIEEFTPGLRQFGWIPTELAYKRKWFVARHDLKKGQCLCPIPEYYVSFDPTMRVFKEQDGVIKLRVEEYVEGVNPSCFWYDVDVISICNALVCAHGKYIEG